jgi:hypothetical protein
VFAVKSTWAAKLLSLEGVLFLEQRLTNEETHNLFPLSSICLLTGMPILNAFPSRDRNLGLLDDRFSDKQLSIEVDPGVFVDNRKEAWRRV